VELLCEKVRAEIDLCLFNAEQRVKALGQRLKAATIHGDCEALARAGPGRRLAVATGLIS
jgi:hypothetical protein